MRYGQGGTSSFGGHRLFLISRTGCNPKWLFQRANKKSLFVIIGCCHINLLTGVYKQHLSLKFLYIPLYLFCNISHSLVEYECYRTAVHYFYDCQLQITIFSRELISIIERLVAIMGGLQVHLKSGNPTHFCCI